MGRKREGWISSAKDAWAGERGGSVERRMGRKKEGWISREKDGQEERGVDQ
jgi:hypothetical protein